MGELRSTLPYVRKFHFVHEMVRTSSKYLWGIYSTSNKCRWSIYRTSMKRHETLRFVHKVERSSPMYGVMAHCCINYSADMMTSSNGNIFRATGHLCGEFTGHRWIARTKASDGCVALMFSLICAWINGWVNNRESGDFRRHRPHYDVTVMNNLGTLGTYQITTKHKKDE